MSSLANDTDSLNLDMFLKTTFSRDPFVLSSQSAPPFTPLPKIIWLCQHCSIINPTDMFVPLSKAPAHCCTSALVDSWSREQIWRNICEVDISRQSRQFLTPNQTPSLLTCLEQIHSQDLNVSNSKYAFIMLIGIKTTSLPSFKLRNPGKYAPFTSCSHI